MSRLQRERLKPQSLSGIRAEDADASGGSRSWSDGGGTLPPIGAGDGSSTTDDAEVSDRLPRSYALLMHLQSGLGTEGAATADDPVLAITQAKAAEATLRAVEAEVRAQERGRRTTLRQRRHDPTRSRSSTRASSALAHYTGRATGGVGAPAPRASVAGLGASGSLQQFRTYAQQPPPQQQSYGYEDAHAAPVDNSWGATSAAAAAGDRPTGRASAAWHHRLAQGRRSVEMWHDPHAFGAQPAQNELPPRAAARLPTGGGGLVPLPPPAAAVAAAPRASLDGGRMGQTATSSDDGMWFPAMARNGGGLGGAVSHSAAEQLQPETAVPADTVQGRGLVSSGSAVSGISGFTEAGYPAAEAAAAGSGAVRHEWDHYAPLPLRSAAPAAAQTDADLHAAEAAADQRLAGTLSNLSGSVKAVDGYAMGTGWRPLASSTYSLRATAIPLLGRESAVTPPPPTPPPPPAPAPAPVAVLRERTGEYTANLSPQLD